MSVVSADIVWYGSANMQETDAGSPQGGAIDLSEKVVFTDLVANDTVDARSDDAADTDQVYRVYGKDAAGSDVYEDFNLNGLSWVAGAQTFERINKVVKQSGSALAGTVTVRKNSGSATLVTLEGAADAGAGTEIDEVRKIFYDAYSDPSSTKDYYEKVFVRNNNLYTTLTSAQIAEQADPTGKCTFALETTLDGSGTSTNRVTAPAAGVGSFDSATKNVANSQNFTAGSAQGTWVKYAAGAGDAPVKSFVTLRTTGNTV